VVCSFLGLSEVVGFDESGVKRRTPRPGGILCGPFFDLGFDFTGFKKWARSAVNF
jgi:hypothetical protein